MNHKPPDGLPTYRLLTGPDDESFCRRVSEALELGYELHGSPAMAFADERLVVAQAVCWPSRRARLERPGTASPTSPLPEPIRAR